MAGRAGHSGLSSKARHGPTRRKGSTKQQNCDKFQCPTVVCNWVQADHHLNPCTIRTVGFGFDVRNNRSVKPSTNCFCRGLEPRFFSHRHSPSVAAQETTDLLEPCLSGNVHSRSIKFYETLLFVLEPRTSTKGAQCHSSCAAPISDTMKGSRPIGGSNARCE